MWLSDVLRSGYDATLPLLGLEVFRLCVAAGLVWKFVFDLHWGAWNYLAPHTYIRYRYDRRPHVVAMSQAQHRVMVVVRLAAATTLLLGVWPRSMALVCAVCLFLELGYDYKFHTIYLAFCCCFLALGPGLGDYFGVVSLVRDGLPAALKATRAQRTDGLPFVAVVLLTVEMYWSSAYYKLRSRQFTTGTLLHQFATHLQLSNRGFPHTEARYPRVAVATLILADPQTARRRWRSLATLTILLEALLPLGLLWRPLWAVAASVGALMHGGFTVLLPRRLMPFTLATIGSYALFNPWLWT